MNNDTDLKEPTEAQIMTGYNLTSARNSFRDYLWEASMCAREAAREGVKAGELEGVMDISDEIADMFTIMGDVERGVADIHIRLRSISKEAGYRAPTQAEFDAVEEPGAGGDR